MRPEKEAMLDEMRGRVEESVFLILADYGGLTVSSGEALREKLGEADAEFHVVKNRLFKHLATEMGVDELQDGLSGPTAMVTGSGEVTEVAKILSDFIKENELPVIKMGALSGVFLSADEIDALAKLPSREELLGQVVGAIGAPLTEFVTVVNGMMGGFVNVLQALEDQKQG